METTKIQVGTRVSYEDMANPRRFGTVTAIDGGYGTEYRIAWDGDKGYAEDYAWSDMRQAGWRIETR